MRILDIYTSFIDDFGGTEGGSRGLRAALDASPEARVLREIAEDWGTDWNETAEWMGRAAYASKRELARQFTGRAAGIVSHVEGIFGVELPGEVWLAPSLGWLDGFARYDSGYHRVILGVDHPDADEAYLRALMAHELSHVYRDHQPAVWAFIGKPLRQVSRAEYLDNLSAREHLVSEGLATLFSQHAYPEVPLRHHHYYDESEMEWCLKHFPKIDHAIRNCLASDENVWSFYGEGRVGAGSPSRTQYFWAARAIGEWLESLAPGRFSETLIEAHKWPAARFKMLQGA